jgi:DNA-binding transcriptional LysR family regulator
MGYPSGTAHPWAFSRAGQIIKFEPTGPLLLDDHELMVEAAISGAALAYVWEERARPHLESGELVECLASWCAPGRLALYLLSDAQAHLRWTACGC